MTSAIKGQIQEDMKAAMRSQDKDRLTTIRLILSALKATEIDARTASTQAPLTDAEVLAVLDKMLKQRRESISQYEAGNRPDLAQKEQNEIEVIQHYLPEPLSDTELGALIQDAITTTAATTVRDMGKVMSILKPKIQGRADIALVSAKIKERLS